MFGFGAATEGGPLIAGLLYQPYYLLVMLVAAAIAWGAPQTWDFTRILTWPKAAWCTAISAAVVAMDLSWAKPAVAYQTTPLEVATIGDIRSMLRLGNREPERAILRQVTAPDGVQVLGASAEVLLLGDSFANIYSHPTLGWGTGAGLAEHLAAGLGRSVDKLAINDNASHATRLALAGDIARGGNRIAGKRVVIYQFASRELAHGDWRTAFP